MKKYENFVNCLNVLKSAEREKAEKDEIYRIGVVGQFNLTFELAWKTLQAVLRLHSVSEAETGSPREILKLGFKYSFINDEEKWLLIQKDRNASVHIYGEEEIERIVSDIFDSHLQTFENFSRLLKQKIDEIESK